jgi:dihydroorotase
MVGSSLLCSIVEGWHDLLRAMTPEEPHYDLLVKGGKAVDPSQGLSAERDVAILGSKIARVAVNIPEGEARQVLNARGKIVTHGLIDIHVHVYEGVTTYGIPPDLAADSGDEIYGELLDLRYADPKLAVRTIEKNRDVILGIKIRLDRDITRDHDIAALRLAREASDAVKLPLMVHIGDTYSPLADILPILNKGDVVTHCFRGEPGGILDAKGRIMPAVRSAIERGVHLDVGHGEGSFSFATAEKAMQQDVLPGTISSDLDHFDVNGPVFDLATTLSKFLHLGLTLEQVIERAATNPANVFAFPRGLGSIREGAEADVAVWMLAEGDYEFVDSQDSKRMGHRKLMPLATAKSGRLYGSSSIARVAG